MAAKKNTKKPKSTGRIKTSGVKRHRYGPIVAVIFLILIGAAGFVGYKVIKSFDNPVLKKTEETSSTTDSAKPDDKKSDDKDSEKIEEDKAKDAPSTRESEKPNLKYEGEGDVNTSESLTGIVNYVGLYDGAFMTRITINQTISNGTCDFTLTSPSGKAYKRSNNTSSSPSSTDCKLNVPFSELGNESGTWKVSVMVKSDNGKSGVISGEGTIK